MFIKFPRGYKVDLDNVPDSFEEDIKECFGGFTSGTDPKFTHHDKLLFIDLMTQKLHRAYDAYDQIKSLILDKVGYQLDEAGDIPNMNEFLTIEFMEQCYEKGVSDLSLYSHFESDDHHVYDKIMELEYRAIKAIIEWEGNDEE